ncbi:adenylate kinase 7 [Brienomyrus brachyistius]|uniref:adenylate kinase 7 n=1 Tax=Brienomyrus brachyistius TaxID=42636 RepID=UPI0020B28222|nr:adenylate kinase 7 [Brienomyrus brachyistius]
MADGKVEKDHRSQVRVFINLIDLFSSKYIGKFLSDRVVGASLEAADSGDEEEPQRSHTFRVVGTVSEPTAQKRSTFTAEEYCASDRDVLLARLMECDVIIYNIYGNADQIHEAIWAVSALHAELDNFSRPKIFILISTVLTWALSKPVDPDDPEAAFTEDDYRRRRSHPNFKDHIGAEKLVIKMGKTKKSRFSTYVVASGLQYGLEEDIFHYFFKMCWLGEASRIPVFGSGQNILPTIHVNDLAGVIQNVIDHKPRTHYLIAVDESKNSLEDIVKALSAELGPGKVARVPKEDIFLTEDLTQRDIDSLFVNLRMEAALLKENFNLHWVSKFGIIDNIDGIVEEYKRARGLLPVRVVILGPPAVGKSSVAERLCKQYKLHHIKLKDAITECIAQLEKQVALEDGDGDHEDAQRLLEMLKENLDKNGGRLDDQFVIHIVKEKLKSKPCRNQGFILDGFPKTYEQAKELFGAEEDESDVSGSKMPPINNKIIPEYVFYLEASDEFLTSRVLNLPENVVQGTHYAQERFLQHLASYRDINTEDETVLNYFDELEIHPEHIEISSHDDVEYQSVMEKVGSALGEPRNYGPSPEERKLLEQRASEERLRSVEAEAAEKQRREAEEEAEREARWKEWTAHLAEVKQQERELQEVQSIPLRNYLMKNVMPTLTQGLIQCCTLKPDDPVDFLAEYIFRNNPQVD